MIYDPLCFALGFFLGGLFMIVVNTLLSMKGRR